MNHCQDRRDRRADAAALARAQGVRPCVDWVVNPAPDAAADSAREHENQRLLAGARLARRFLRTLPGSAPTPLHPLPALARRLGLDALLVKDESCRFGLGAFKGLGSAWAVARILARRLDLPPERVALPALTSPQARRQLGELCLVTATDGNHGRGLAWATRLLGQRAVVFMPRGAAAERMAAIRAQGADCMPTDHDYDDTVRQAAAYARATGGILVQDTAWPGYEEIPGWIMEGYGVLALELADQCAGADDGEDGKEGKPRDARNGANARPPWPTHVFLQAGVGSFAAAIVACLTALARQRGWRVPRFVSMEPQGAACVLPSIAAGRPQRAAGELATRMAGLCCGELSSLAWPVLRAGLHSACACPDWLAARGMRLLARPDADDRPLVSGESGAIGAGLVEWLMCADDAREARAALGLTPASAGRREKRTAAADSCDAEGALPRQPVTAAVLLISTEGATAPWLWAQATGLPQPAPSGLV